MEWDEAHSAEIAAVDAFEALGDNGFDAEESGAFGRPIAGGAGAVFLSGDDDEWGAVLLVAKSGIVDGEGFAGGLEAGNAAFGAWGEEIFDTNIGESASGHDAIVSATGAVAIEVVGFDAIFGEEEARWAGFFDGASGGDVVGGHAIAEDTEGASVEDFVDVTWLHGEVGEEGGFLDVGAGFVPSVDIAGGARDFVPLGILGREVGVEASEDLRAEGGLHGGLDFGEGGPEIAEEDGGAIGRGGEGIGGEIEIDVASDGESDHEWGRHQEIGFDVLVDAGFEVAVSREDAGGDEIIGSDGVFDGGVEWSTIANAGGATVADGLEAELIEIGLEARFGEVIGDDAGAWSEGSFDHGADGEASFYGFFGEEPGGEHHAGVGGIGAAGDGGDEDGSVGDGGIGLAIGSLWGGSGYVDGGDLREVGGGLAIPAFG